MPVPRTPDPLPAPPLRRQEAERRLRNAIVKGDLAPGERLPEDELAAWLGVSRTPVREALTRLAATGLVTIDANRGARVAPLEPAEMLDLVQVSRGLVLLAQRLACERATRDEIAAMRELHGQRLAALRSGDVAAVERGARGFHDTILRASRNRDLQRLYPQVFHRLERVFRHAYPEWLRQAGADTDGRILAAIEARDPEAVLEVSSRDWDALEAAIRAYAAALAGDAAPLPPADRRAAVHADATANAARNPAADAEGRPAEPAEVPVARRDVAPAAD